MKYHRKPTPKDKALIRSLIKICKKQKISIQANAGTLIIDGIHCVKVTPDGALIQGMVKKAPCIQINL